jgi:hypothetical protein
MCAYRADDGGETIEATTAEGPLRLELGPRHVRLAVAQRTLDIADQFATLVLGGSRERRVSERVSGRLVVARDVPREDLGVWIEEVGQMRRLFGVAPLDLMADGGLDALRGLDRLAARLRTALAGYAGDIRRAVEVGRGKDKVLLADHGDRFALYARRLFRDRARLTLEIRDDGQVTVIDGDRRTTAVVRHRFGVTVVGDYLRFADLHGEDLARVAVPWVTSEDRLELARRIGQLIHREPGEPWEALASLAEPTEPTEPT